MPKHPYIHACTHTDQTWGQFICGIGIDYLKKKLELRNFELDLRNLELELRNFEFEVSYKTIKSQN